MILKENLRVSNQKRKNLMTIYGYLITFFMNLRRIVDTAFFRRELNPEYLSDLVSSFTLNAIFNYFSGQGITVHKSQTIVH